MNKILAGVALCCATAPAIAQTQTPTQAPSETPTQQPLHAVNLNVGTLGIGAGFNFALGNTTSLRIGLAGWNYRRSFEKSGVDYDAKLKLANAPILLDWYPGGGMFRMTAGIIPNATKYTLDAKASSGGTFTFNNNTYLSSEVSNANGTVKFQNSVAPYLGAGFSRSMGETSGWSWGMDFGFMYLGKPKTSLTVTCGTTPRCAQLQSDANAEAAQLQNDISDFRWYPVFQTYFAKTF